MRPRPGSDTVRCWNPRPEHFISATCDRGVWEDTVTTQDIAAARRAYYSQNRERILQKRREHYLKNRDKLLEYSRDYYQQNKGKIRAKSKRWYEENRSRKSDYWKQYYQLHREVVLERNRQRYIQRKAIQAAKGDRQTPSGASLN
jgi:hypothetical protein